MSRLVVVCPVGIVGLVASYFGFGDMAIAGGRMRLVGRVLRVPPLSQPILVLELDLLLRFRHVVNLFRVTIGVGWVGW